MAKPDLSDLEPHWNCRLTARGRKSGEPRSVTIWFALGPGIVYVTGSKGEPQWCRNIRACGDVELRIGSRTLKGRARVIDDAAEAEAIRQRFVERYLLARLSRPFGGYTDSVPVVIEIAD
jgi:deazaflavin-dependent oxidoreductase (nitroreductase family)